MNKIKWIIFDLGGIVVPEIGNIINHEIANALSISADTLEGHLGKYKRQITAGSLTLLEMYSEIRDELNSQLSPEYLLHVHLNTYIAHGNKHNNDVVLFIQYLRKNYNVACLTNLEIEIEDICRKTGLYDYFDKAFLSTELKMQKPDLEIYYKVLEELKCRADETVFIDDRTENVNAAKEIGMHTVFFSSPAQIKTEILKICNAFNISHGL
jgi:HAD superfamily hydrolase (TIGR01509 family)